MDALDSLPPIDENRLHPRHYTESLLRQAVSCGLLSDEDMAKIRSGLLEILAKQWDIWSRGESSSVPVEKAQDMMHSALFVIGVGLKACRSPKQAAEQLKTQPAALLYESGQQIIRRKLAAARLIQRKITNHLLETPNVFYRSTIVERINGFFKLYRPQLDAHELHITADYPVLAGRPDLDGIEFIEQYLRCIEAENTFCVQFRAQDVHHLLCGLTRDYRSVPVNLFEYVVLSALGLVLLGHDPRGLDLTAQDTEKLYSLFSGKSGEETAGCLAKAARVLSRQGLLPESVRRYLVATLPKLASDVQNAVKMKTPDKLFLIPAYPERDTVISLGYGERMEDKSYQRLVDTLLQTESAEEKVALILQAVHSLADLLDILSDAKLNAAELNALIGLLPFSAYVALLSQYPEKDFLDRESERLLYDALQNRRCGLSPAEKEQVSQALRAIRRDGE